MKKLLLQCGLLRIVSGSALCILLPLFISFQSFAQEDFKPKFGVIDRPSLEMTAYPGDSTADAVYLYDFGEVKFSYDQLRGLVMTMDTWVRVKILKESALNRASVGLSYFEGSSFKEKERIEGLKGYTYNMEGGKVITTELDKKAIKREKSGGSYYAVNFNLPNVKKGSVIEYSYTRTTPLNVRIKPDTWTFQGSIPFKWSEYRITVPHFMDYKMTVGGYLPLYISERNAINVNVGHSQFDGPGIAYRFVVKDSPAFINEPFITTELDYLSKLSFGLSSIVIPGEINENYAKSWGQVEQMLNEASWFGGELKKTSYLREVKDEISKKTKDPQERMMLAYSHMQKYMKWNGDYGLGSDEGVKKAYENKKGSVSDVNLALIILLRELDLDCNPMLISTRSHGQVFLEIPMAESFNYVVSHVQIGEQQYFLDATQTYAKPGMLPEHALNRHGRLLSKTGEGKFLEIIPADLQSKLEMVNATINPEDGTMTGNYSISYGGYEALDWREKYVKEAESVFHDDLKKQAPEWQIQNIAIKNKAEDLKGTVTVSCDFEVEDENASPGIFYFNPILMGKWTSNPLKSKERIYPVDLASGMSSSFIGNFKLPEGYALEEMPKAEVVVLPDKGGRFAYQVRQTGNVIQVNSLIIVNRTRFMPEEYEHLKEFFERIVQKHAQPLVIKKRTN
jgi:hypothetical protein